VKKARSCRRSARWRRLHPTALLVIAPRKPERFGEAEMLARAEGYRVVRRSELPVDAEPGEDVVILDTVGELAQLFQIATWCSSAVASSTRAATTILEPAVHGKAIVFVRTCRTFRKSPSRSSPAGRASSWRPTGSCPKSSSGSPAIRRSERVSAPPRARSFEANRGARPATLDAIAALVPPRAAARSCGRFAS